MKPKLPAKREGGEDCKSKSDPPLSEADKEALDAFCDKVSLEECSLDRWVASHSDLDLTVPVWLTPEEAATGCAKEVKFSRSVGKGPREKDRVEVELEPGASTGMTFRFKGLGDRKQDCQGDLIVRVRVK